MVDNSKQADMGGNTILANNIVLGVPSGAGSSGITGGKATGGYARVDGTRYILTGVDFNTTTTDFPLAIYLPGGSATERYTISAVYINNASASISTATISVRGGAGATGATIAADQAITVTATAAATANNTMTLTLTNANTMAYVYPTLYIRIGTPQGTAATADVIIELNLLS